MSGRTDRALALRCLVGLFVGFGWAALPGLVHAQGQYDGGPVRVGDYQGFGRVALDFPSPTAFDVVEEGDRLLIVFAGPLSLGAGPVSALKPPRNVQAIRGGAGSATLVLAPGVRFRTSRVGNRVVIDVLDPVPDTPARPAVRMPPRSPEPAAPAAPIPVAPQSYVRPSTVALLKTQSSPQSAPVITAAAPAPTLPQPVISAPVMPKAVLSRPTPASRALALRASALPASEPSLEPVQIADAPQAAPVTPVIQNPLPDSNVPVASTTANLPSISAGPDPSHPDPLRIASILVPLDPGIGAAAFRRGDSGLVVFDQRVPLDLAVLPGSVALGASVQFGQASTMLNVPLAPSQALVLLRQPQGWSVARADDVAPTAVIETANSAAGLVLKLDRPGRVVTVADPLTGVALLVGTIDLSSGAGPAVAPARRAPFYSLSPTWLGVMVEPLADTVELRQASAGFILVSPGLSPGADAQAVEPFTRRFDFPDLPIPALLQRLHAQVAAAAAAAPRARTGERIAAAQSLLSLGLATEAQAILALVAAEDPAAAADATLPGLMAIAALLAGRSAEAAGLDDPRLDGADDIALWRGVRDAMRDADSEAGRLLPRLLPLANAYPAALRDRLRPLVIEAAVATGQAALVASALAKPGPDKPADPGLDFARALALERDGDTEAALLAYDALVAGRDQLTQVRAGSRAIELRLRQNAITPAQAADILERQAAIWRGDGRESRMRLRAAELRTAAAAFRPALDLLRDTERVFPEQKPAIRTAMASVFQAMLSQPQAVSPLDLITIASDYAPLLPEGSGGDTRELLANKLVALDLPERAGPVLASLMAAAGPGHVRASMGARLAQMHVDSASFAAAQAALDASDAPGLPSELGEQRSLLMAQARAAQGDMPSAIAALLSLGTAAADDLRATLLGQAGDWPGSLAALSDLAAKTVPPTGPLSDTMQTIVLRQATSAVQANDAAMLADLQRRHGARLAGPRADLFRLLTAEPLSSPTDLPRAATELALARLLPDRLQALSARNTK